MLIRSRAEGGARVATIEKRAWKHEAVVEDDVKKNQCVSGA